MEISSFGYENNLKLYTESIIFEVVGRTFKNKVVKTLSEVVKNLGLQIHFAYPAYLLKHVFVVNMGVGIQRDSHI